jgi:hypothetical protein
MLLKRIEIRNMRNDLEDSIIYLKNGEVLVK